MSVKSREHRAARKAARQEAVKRTRQAAWRPAKLGSTKPDKLDTLAAGMQAREAVIGLAPVVHDIARMVWRDHASDLGMRVAPSFVDPRDPLDPSEVPMDVADLFRIARATFKKRKAPKAKASKARQAIESHAPEYRTEADYLRAVQNARIAASLAGTW